MNECELMEEVGTFVLTLMKKTKKKEFKGADIEGWIELNDFLLYGSVTIKNLKTIETKPNISYRIVFTFKIYNDPIKIEKVFIQEETGKMYGCPCHKDISYERESLRLAVINRFKELIEKELSFIR